MKILFVYSGIARVGFDSFKGYSKSADISTYALPFGICYLAGSVDSSGHEPDFLDLRMLKGFDEVESRIAASNADVVALSFQSPDRDFGFRTAEIAKRLGKIVIVGGLHASMQTNDCVESGLFHTVFTGPGETVLVDYIRSLEKEEKTPKIIVGQNPEDLDSLAFPYLFPEYVHLYNQMKMAMVLISRGCFGKCTYCYPAPEKAFGSKVIIRSIENVKKEIEFYKTKFKFNQLCVLDDLFLSNRKITRQFTEMIKEFDDLTFRISTRAELLNESNIELLKESVDVILIGFESGSQKVLNSINKRTTAKTNFEVGKLLNKYGIGMNANILNCLPGQTRDDYDQNIKLLEAANPEYIYFNCFSPMPGTHLHDYCQENNLLPDKFPYEWYECVNVLKHRLIKGVDYDLFQEYAKQVEKLLSKPHLGRDYRSLIRNPANFELIQDLKKVENGRVFILRSGPEHLLRALLKMLENLINPKKVSILTTPGLDPTGLDSYNIHYLKNKWMSLEGFQEQSNMYQEITETEYDISFMLIGALSSDSYIEPNKIFSAIKAKKSLTIDVNFSMIQ